MELQKVFFFGEMLYSPMKILIEKSGNCFFWHVFFSCKSISDYIIDKMTNKIGISDKFFFYEQ
jgi:hypothetical protein